MLESYFDKLKTITTQSAFVSNLYCSKQQGGPLFLVACQFDIKHYVPALYSEFGITLPAELYWAVPKRQAEFLAGRLVAKHALIQLGFPYERLPTIQTGLHRSPVWPTGFCGSISHNNARAVCLLSDSQFVQALGVDIETIMSPQQAADVASSIHNLAEQQLLKYLPPALATTLLFSAKESIFKALYPQVECYFGFECARLTRADLTKGVLEFHIEHTFQQQHQLKARHLCYFEFYQDYLVTAVVDRE